MGYKPKVIKGFIKETGWPIDGHILYLSQWSYDNHESWHLRDWETEDDEAVMQTVFKTENEAGIFLYDSFDEFAKAWKEGEWEPQGSFCLGLNQVDVLEVLQEEQLT